MRTVSQGGPSARHAHVLPGQRRQPGLSFGSWAFAFGPYAGSPWSFKRVCEFAAEAGYDGVEINGFRPHPHPSDFDTDAKCTSLLQMITDLGLGVSGYAPDFSDAPPGEVAQAEYMRQLDLARRFCERMGITTLRVDSVSSPEPLEASRYEARLAQLTATFGVAAERLARSGIGLVWEFEPGFWLNKPSEVLRVIQMVDHPNFKVLFDTSHALTSAMGRRQAGNVELLAGGATEYAELIAEHVGHLHLIDSVGDLHDDETSEHLPFGTGSVDFDAVLSALGPAAGGLEWWTVDFCFWPRTEVDGRAAVQFVRELATRHTGGAR